MRIVLVNPEFYPVLFGGISRVVYDIAQGLSRRGHNITVLTTDAHQSGDVPLNEPVRISHNLHAFYVKTVFRFLQGRKIYIPSLGGRQLIKDVVRKADLIHIHSYRNPMSVLVSRTARRFGKPYVIQTHGTLPRIIAMRELKFIYDQLFGRAALFNAAKVIGVNLFEARQFGCFGIPADKIAIVPNGIDIQRYRRVRSSPRFRHRNGIRNGQRIVLFLGRLHFIKGVDLLIRALSVLVSNPEFNNVVLIIAGPDDGFLNNALRLTAELKLGNKVCFPGFLDEQEVQEALAEAEVVAFPSRYEIYGMSLLEAYACRKAVIASDVGGLSELVLDGVTGVLVESENISALASGLSDLLKNDKVRLQMGQNARSLLVTSYTIEKTLDKLETLYASVLQKGG